MAMSFFRTKAVANFGPGSHCRAAVDSLMLLGSLATQRGRAALAEERQMAQEIEIDPQLEERLALVAQPDYEGEPMTGGDYRAVLAVTLLLPIVLLLIAGWML
jgi:hypothetical protein